MGKQKEKNTGMTQTCMETCYFDLVIHCNMRWDNNTCIYDIFRIFRFFCILAYFKRKTKGKCVTQEINREQGCTKKEKL